MSVIEDLKRNRDKALETKPGKIAGIIGAILSIPLAVTSFIAEKSLKFATSLGSAFLDMINAPDNFKSLIRKPFDWFNGKVGEATDYLKKTVWFAPKTAASETKEFINLAEDVLRGRDGEEAFYDENFRRTRYSSNEYKPAETKDLPASDEVSGAILRSPSATHVLSGRVVGQEPEEQNQI
jgi:hypothetical protein